MARVVGERVVATRVNGKDWMYYGVPQGFFDSWLVEPGPPALLTERGIVLLYNAGNSATAGDPRLPARTYSAGQALFDSRDPLKLIDRWAEPFLQPTEDYERTGQYLEGTTFVEGLVPFRGRWLLYYGTADSRVAVAVATAVASGTGARP